jgi:peptidoglycan/LPS O-acetylase OafA/YrhL
MNAPARIGALDGWRAIAIVLVLLAHASHTRNVPLPPGAGLDFLATAGHLGVVIFFVISGFLITTLLMREHAETGTISLKQFYARRALRIFPASYAYVLAMIAAAALGWIEVSGGDFAMALTYLTNYNAHRSWYIGHLWSLSVEEQFYLLWPFVLMLAGRRRGFVAALAAFLLAPAVRLGMHLMLPAGPYRDLEIFPAVADGIAAGCLMALARPWLLQRAWYLRFTQHGAIWLLLPLAIVVHSFNGYTIIDVFAMPPLLIGLAVLIEASTRRVGTLSARILNATPMVAIGTLSYSLYLWQQPFLSRGGQHIWTLFPYNIGFVVAAATASYLLVERPFLRMRGRFAAPRTRARTVDAASAAAVVAGSSRLPE